MAETNPIKRHPNFKDITGQRFGRLTVVREANRSATSHSSRWVCRCDCGTERVVAAGNLRAGKSTSCGCLHREMVGELGIRLGPLRVTHGMSRSSEYRSWNHMIQRCSNPNNDAYLYYGARGIAVCERWLTFENFLDDMGRKPFRGATIERISGAGNYEPGNCRWATRAEQSRNKRDTVMLSHDGKTMCIADWAKKLGIKYNTLHGRLKSGWPIERALSVQ